MGYYDKLQKMEEAKKSLTPPLKDIPKVKEQNLAQELSPKTTQEITKKTLNRKSIRKTKPQENKKSKETSTQKVTQNITQDVTQKTTQVSKILSKLPSANDLEALYFSLRKEQKARVNADVPQEWKRELDTIANELEVGKYELMLYVIAQFLGKTKRKK